jgi:IclR family transcriptional regulator, pca regulon regulatory protein
MTGASESKERQYAASLAHGLVILACFSGEHPVLGIKDIAESLGMSRPTTHRYVVTLFALGYLEQINKNHKYRLAPRAGNLGMAALDSLGLRACALPHLQKLRIRSRCTASMAILDRGVEVMYVARARSRHAGQHEIDLGQRIGSRLPAHCTALGKLLLAYLPEDEQREALKALKLSPRTPHTITSKKVMRVELERIRERKIALNDKELAPHLQAIAAPVRGEGGEVVAAVSIAAHTSRVSHEELVQQLKPHLVAATDGISIALGYGGNDETALGEAA